MAKKIVRWIIFGILYTLIGAFMLFYLDLANGPFYLLIAEIILLVGCLLMRIGFRNNRFLLRNMVFVFLIGINVVTFFVAKPKVKAFSPLDLQKTNVYTESMQLENGKIQGIYNDDKSVQIYAGIPYAKAPVGDLRWKEPQDVENWDGVKVCDTFGPRAMQVDQAEVISSLVDIYAMKGWHPDYSTGYLQEMSEDCLYLNIWKPNTNETNLPILVYIHGGSLNTGSSSFYSYNGETMAKNGVIMITIAYRLGVFGYFASSELEAESPNHTTGNYGLLDQIKALEWVNKNAEYFGGDKNNITIAGESAGSSSVCALCTSPLAHGLFKKAIGESSSLALNVPPHTFRTMEEAKETGQNIMNEFGANSIKELRNIPAEKLVKTSFPNTSMTIDGYALTKTPYEVYLAHENNEVALLNGYNAKEADAFVVPNFLFSPTNKNNIKERLIAYFDEETADKIYTLYKDKIEEDAFSAFNEIISVYWFIYPHHSWSKLACQNGVNVYRYYFTKENGYYGTYHSGELVYFYGNLARKKTFAYNDSDYALQDKIVSYLVSFIKTGNPNNGSQPLWNLYQNEGDQVLELGESVQMIDDEFLELYKIIEEFNQKNIGE